MASETLYTKFFGLTERPFTLVPDPSFMFWSPMHKRAFSILEFGILSRAPITLITGEIGSGKTTLVQALLAQIEDDVTIGLISNAHGGRGELLQWTLNSLAIEINPAASYVQMFQALQDFLLAEYAQSGRVVLIFDEAQNLSLEGLEEIRMLTNINSNKDVLIQLILVGQPELRAMVEKPNMRQLAQRVSASFHLIAMDPANVRDYISHRLRTAGGSGQEFTAEACNKVYHITRGVPRLINQLCDFAMLYAWSDNSTTITESTLDQVLKDKVYFDAQIPTEEPLVLFSRRERP